MSSMARPVVGSVCRVGIKCSQVTLLVMHARIAEFVRETHSKRNQEKEQNPWRYKKYDNR
jgi:hypothetical protein